MRFYLRNFRLTKRLPERINFVSRGSAVLLNCSFSSEKNILASQRDGVAVRASALQLVNWGFISLVESYQKTLKNGIYTFFAWHLAFMGDCGEQAGKFACCVLGQGT